MSTERYRGSCHCGAARFEAELDLGKGGMRCNCSVCTKTSSFNTIIKPEAFTLLSDPAALSMYEHGPKISKRYFCSTCGVSVFGRGFLEHVGGDFVSVSLNCLDGVELSGMPAIYWDGRHDNWQSGPRGEAWPIL